MHYFPSRFAAGNLIADQLEPKYRYENCVVLALGNGSVMVGAAIAQRLHCAINLLVLSGIRLPQELADIAVMDNFGGITYDDSLSPGELEELRSEYFNYIEQQKLQRLFEMNRLLGSGGVIEPDMLRDNNIIIVSDGLANGFSMKAAKQFLKPIRTERIIMTTPFASTGAVDIMHMFADEMVCLNVLEDIISIDHYYEDPSVPDQETVITVIQDIVLNWK